MEPQGLDALFTKESLKSLHVAAAATLLVPNVLVSIVGPSLLGYEKWVALGVAMLIAIVVTERTQRKDWTLGVIIALNGLLIYSAAVGLTEILGAVSAGDGTAGERAGFFHSWYP
jgi:hypothetical protein